MTVLNSPLAPSSAHHSDFRMLVDEEHSGVRLAGCLVFLVTVVVSFMLINSLTFGGQPALSAIGSVVIALGLTYLTDYVYKRISPSTRMVEVSVDTIRITNKGEVERTLDPQQQVNLLLWYFEAPKHPRVPKGWYVVCSALEQDNQYIPVYTLVEPKVFEQFAYAQDYFKHNRKDKRKKKDDVGRDLRLAGQQRRIEEAEAERGFYGAETSPEQYQQYMAYLTEHFAKWMPS